MTLIPALSWAGTIAVAAPTVESNRYVVPIVLEDAEGVSSLDFQLQYDPAVFTPVSVSAGASTTAAGKVVEAHSATPGAYSVLVMGVNQNSLPPGEVARVVLERVDGVAAESTLAVASPTLANAQGDVLASQGNSRVVQLRAGGEAPTGETPSDEPQPDEPTPATPGHEQPEPEMEPGELVEDKGGVPLAQQVADAMLAGLEEHRRVPDGRGGVSTDPSPRVSGEATPQPRYSIMERRLPGQVEFEEPEQAEKIEVAQAEASGTQVPPSGAHGEVKNKQAASSVSAGNTADSDIAVDTAGEPAITIEENNDVLNPVAAESELPQGVRWELLLVFVPVAVLTGYAWRRRRDTRS